MLKLLKDGIDNYGKQKVLYFDKIAAMNEEELFDETKDMIWLSAYASNNPRSDYHWRCSACYSECVGRGRERIYTKAFTSASEE